MEVAAIHMMRPRSLRQGDRRSGHAVWRRLATLTGGLRVWLRGTTALALHFRWRKHVRLWVRLYIVFDDEREDRVLALGRVASEHLCAHKGPECGRTAIAFDHTHTRTHALGLTDKWMYEWVDGALMRLVQSPANTRRKHLWRDKHVWAPDYHHMRPCARTQHTTTHAKSHT